MCDVKLKAHYVGNTPNSRKAVSKLQVAHAIPSHDTASPLRGVRCDDGVDSVERHVPVLRHDGRVDPRGQQRAGGELQAWVLAVEEGETGGDAAADVLLVMYEALREEEGLAGGHHLLVLAAVGGDEPAEHLALGDVEDLRGAGVGVRGDQPANAEVEAQQRHALRVERAPLVGECGGNADLEPSGRCHRHEREDEIRGGHVGSRLAGVPGGPNRVGRRWVLDAEIQSGLGVAGDDDYGCHGQSQGQELASCHLRRELQCLRGETVGEQQRRAR